MQKTLYDFFEIVQRSDWQITLNSIIKSKKLNIWDVDVVALANGYMELLEKESDFNKTATGLLICSIILKYKSHKLNLKELELIIEQEIEEIKEDDEIKEIDLPEDKDLDDFVEKLDQLLPHKVKSKNNVKKKKERKIILPKIKEDFSITISKLYSFLKNKQKITYSLLKKNYSAKNNIFLALLFLNAENKVSLNQNQFYEDFDIFIQK